MAGTTPQRPEHRLSLNAPTVTVIVLEIPIDFLTFLQKKIVVKNEDKFAHLGADEVEQEPDQLRVRLVVEEVCVSYHAVLLPQLHHEAGVLTHLQLHLSPGQPLHPELEEAGEGDEDGEGETEDAGVETAVGSMLRLRDIVSSEGGERNKAKISYGCERLVF